MSNIKELLRQLEEKKQGQAAKEAEVRKGTQKKRIQQIEAMAPVVDPLIKFGKDMLFPFTGGDEEVALAEGIGEPIEKGRFAPEGVPAVEVPDAAAILSEPAEEPELEPTDTGKGLPGGLGDSDMDKDTTIAIMKGDTGVKDAVPTDPVATAFKKEVDDSTDKFNRVKEKALAAYASSKDSVAQKALWEGLINGFGMIAAGVYGLNTGRDMSGVKFSVTDWDKKLKAAREELNSAISMATADRATKDRMAMFKSGQAERLENRLANEAWKARQMEFQKEQFEYQKGHDRLKLALANSKEKAKSDPEALKLHKQATDILAKSIGGDDDAKEVAYQRILDLNRRYKIRVGVPIMSPATLAKKERLFGLLSDRIPTETEIAKGLNQSAPAATGLEEGETIMRDPASGKNVVVKDGKVVRWAD